MNNNLKITCPKCKATFDAGDAFNAHFENTQIENEKKLKEVTKKAQQEAENKFKLQFEKQQEEIEKIKKAESKKANEEAEKKYKAQLENKDKQLAEVQKNLEHKLKEESEKKLELAKKEAIKKAEELAGKKFQVLIDKQKEELEKSKKSEEILKKRVDERTQEISQIMQNRKVELQGEIQEERLQDFLRRKFPEDTVEEIKKGAKGGDCILSINHKGKKNIAKIYFESKDTKNFSEAWVDKLLSDMKDKGIANGIIVVSKSALPSDFDETSSFVQRHSSSIKIIPMELDIIHAVVDGIRSILILKSRENNDHEIPDLMKKCWINLNSPNFILPIKTMVAQIRIMENLFKKEKDSFERTSAIKDRTIKEIQANLVAMVTSFNRNVGDIFPQDLLEHKDDKYLE
jgi:chemotaxis protein histidine kinase CheA